MILTERQNRGMTMTEKQRPADQALSDEQLSTVVGGTTFRVDAETEPSVIVIRNRNGTGDYPVHTHGDSAVA